MLSALLFEDERYAIDRIVSFDIDPDCEAVAACLNRENARSGRFTARTADMLELDYATDRPDLIINTSCEHIPDIGAWLDTPEPKDRVVAFLDAATPLVKWLDTNVGPTELVDDRWG